MSTLPPPRYRVVERGRRLVTVDLATGQEIGLGATLAHVGLEGRRQTMAAAVPLAAPVLARSEPPRPAPLPIQPQTNARAASALAPARVTSGMARPADILSPIVGREAALFTPGHPSRLIALIVAAAFIVLMLLATGTWPLPVILFLIPQTRAWLLSLGAAAVRKALGQDANG